MPVLYRDRSNGGKVAGSDIAAGGGERTVVAGAQFVGGGGASPFRFVQVPRRARRRSRKAPLYSEIQPQLQRYLAIERTSTRADVSIDPEERRGQITAWRGVRRMIQRILGGDAEIQVVGSLRAGTGGSAHQRRRYGDAGTSGAVDGGCCTSCRRCLFPLRAQYPRPR